MVASGRSARHLHIDQPFIDPIAPHGLVQHPGQRFRRHRNGDAQLVQAAMQARHVTVEIGQPAVEHRPDLIDAVGELEAAILDVDHGLAVRLVLAVDVGDAAHSSMTSSMSSSPPRDGDTPSDFSFR
jgi:hypothetical protein